MNFEKVMAVDSEIAQIMQKELGRQRDHLELIASENFVSPAVLEAMGSPLTNKYAEGYPGARFYGGCEYVDEVESIAIARCKELFGCEHANVQPHSGSQANVGVYVAMLTPGDTILGMNLSHGGHLTHGSKVSISGKHYKSVFYGVDAKTELIDYDNLRQMALEHKPKLIIAGASAYARYIDFDKFREVCDLVGAYLMVDIAHIIGLVATGEHPSPIAQADFVTSTTHKTLRGPRGGLIMCKQKYAKAIDSAMFPGTQGGPLMHTIAAKAVCFKEAASNEFKVYQQQIRKNASQLAASLSDKGLRLVSGGTDNHLMLVDLISMNINGKELQDLLDNANITANRNSIPNDPLPPSLASGLRLGTPAVTTRGMKEAQMVQIADMIFDIMQNRQDAVSRVKAQVIALCNEFPLYS